MIKPPIQQPSPAQSTQSAQERITRQKFLKWAGLGGVGLVTAVVGHEIFKGQSPTSKSINQLTNKLTTISIAESKYIPFKFETVTVDEKV
ncbi:MAG: hypothetical protein KME50_04470 [Nostoc desertorum CM1-VF14]|nr:hypothetical protein [Nostoc desertorum CM1-VF14]